MATNIDSLTAVGSEDSGTYITTLKVDDDEVGSISIAKIDDTTMQKVASGE